MTTTETFTGWCCVDCLMLIANGEANPEWSEEEETKHLEAMAIASAGCEVTLGLLWSEHSEDCPNRAAGEWVEECYCEWVDFTWSSCDTCGSHLGGSRDAVTFWPKEETK